MFADSPLDTALPASELQALTALLARIERALAAQPKAAPPPAAPAGAAVRYYPRDGSVFIDGAYLIKGVAGAIFWKLVREHAGSGRADFSTRELRLSGAELGLPDTPADNLDARLLLLRRRLAERDAPARIEQTGRGRYRLVPRCALVPQAEGAEAAPVRGGRSSE
jgi:hypothetical protein